LEIHPLGIYASVMSGAPKADEDELSTAYPSDLPSERELREKEPIGPPPQ